jgi:hypothetical protein
MPFALALSNTTLDHAVFVASPKWHFLRQKAVAEGGTLYFRKFSFPVIDDIQYTHLADIKNIMSYGCQRTNRHPDFIVFHIPTWIDLKGINPDGWISQLDVHLAVDRLTFTAVGEYRSRELFIDLSDDNRDGIFKLLISEEILVEFGPKSERISIYQKNRSPTGGNIAGYMDDIVPMLSSQLGGGKVESLEMETVLERCKAYKRSGRY